MSQPPQADPTPCPCGEQDFSWAGFGGGQTGGPRTGPAYFDRAALSALRRWYRRSLLGLRCFFGFSAEVLRFFGLAAFLAGTGGERLGFGESGIS